MQQNTPGHTRFEEYLAKIEDMERARRRKRWLVLVPLALVGGTTVFMWPQQLPSPAASTNEVVLVKNEATPIVPADHAAWMRMDAQAVLPANQPAAEQAAIEQDSEAKEKIWFSVDIAGRRQVKETLTFKIENYRPGFTYVLDFGNGVEKEVVGESVTYRYPLAGHFDMKLTATSPEGEVIEYIKKYEIAALASATTARAN